MKRCLVSVPPPKRFSLLGVPVDLMPMVAVVDRVDSFFKSNKPHQIITANPLIILASEKNADLRESFHRAELVVSDSVGVVWGARFHGQKAWRVPGIELMDHLCAQAQQQGRSVYLLGAAPGVANRAKAVLLKKYPTLKIVGVGDGYFSKETENEVVSRVSALHPDYLFVALDTPRQDGWIHRNKHRLNARVVMGVGGSFDVISGRLHRAPSWMCRLGLEWFFRLCQEPTRARRMMGLPVFLFRVIFS